MKSETLSPSHPGLREDVSGVQGLGVTVWPRGWDRAERSPAKGRRKEEGLPETQQLAIVCKAVRLTKNEKKWRFKDFHKRELLMTEQWKEHELW